MARVSWSESRTNLLWLESVLTRSALAILLATCLFAPLRATAAPPPPEILINTSFVRPGQPVTFTGFSGSVPPLPVILSFGDGAQVVIASATFSVTHAYGHPGIYTVLLQTPSGAIIDSLGIVVTAGVARVPLGAIYSTTVDASPVLAGSVVQLTVAYRIALAAAPTQDVSPALQAIVDLDDADGNLVHRSDPTQLGISIDERTMFASIPYAVPVDARGQYHVRVFIQAVDRGVVAVGPPVTLDVTGNSPGDTIAAAGAHASGSVEMGRRPQITGETVNPGLTAASQASSLATLSAFSDPVSNRVDPLLALTTLLRVTLTSPDSLDSQPKPAPLALVADGRPQYYDALGRTLVSMPQIIGGPFVLRGLDLRYRTAPGWTFQGGIGNTELFYDPYGSPRTFEQLGDAFELGKSWSSGDSVQFFHHGRGDNPQRFLGYPQDLIGPQIADVNALEATHEVGRHIVLSGAGAFSTYSATYRRIPLFADSADLTSIDYHNGLTSLTMQYHNAGQSFTPGEGLQALSDRAGVVASASLPVSPRVLLDLDWDREGTRSVSSAQSMTSATLAFDLGRGFNAQATAAREHELTDSDDVTTDSIAVHASRVDAQHAFGLDTAVIGTHDFIDDVSSATLRTASAQYSFQSGINAIGLGIDALQRGGKNFPESQVTESLTDGVAFGGVRRRIGLQTGLAVTNEQFRFGTGNVSTDLTGSLSYGLFRGVTLGLKGERTLFQADCAGPRAVRCLVLKGGMRFVLIVER